jgi:hypothetical protein
MGRQCGHGPPAHTLPALRRPDRRSSCGEVSSGDLDRNWQDSENVLVNWSNPKLAEVYLRHFERNYAQATAYKEGY